MRLTRTTLAAFALVALSAGPQAWAPRPITIDDVVHLKGVGAPQISPDGTRILFTVRGWEWPGGKVEPDKGTKAPEARTHVWIVPANGSEPARQITFGDKGETSPVWSPDGRYISFTSTRSAGPAAPSAGDADTPREQIWLMRADGGEAWPLTEAKESVTTYEWAPDSKRIAFLMRDPLSKEADEARRRKDDERVAEANTQMPHLWVVDVESKGATSITGGDDFGVRSFTWSADSTKIAAAITQTTMSRDERQDIHVITIATKQREPIAATPAIESNPRGPPTAGSCCLDWVSASTAPSSLMTSPAESSPG